MKCFYFPSTEPGERGLAGGGEGTGGWAAKVPWARSSSIASSSSETRRSGFVPGVGEETWSMERRPEGLRAFRFAELKEATKGFSRAMLIGEGGFGCVYRGVICISGEEEGVDGVKTMNVAVKQHNKYGSQGHREWITEVNYLGVVKHPNLVRLVGYCAEDNERGIQRLLVYELMLNKSLEDHLLARIPSKLSWELRLKIAHGAARGLAYLHEEMDFQLIFRDFKSSNILLDEDFNAKLSDFGLARHGPLEGVCCVSTSVVGTVGYAAPEYVQMGKLTSKSDVWSYGVVLYEIITGRRSIERNLPKNEQKLLDWVKHYATDPKKLHIIIDPKLKGNYSIKSVQKIIALANRCLRKRPKARPSMSKVVEMLDEIIEMPNEECMRSVASSDVGEGDDEGKIGLKDSIINRIKVFDLKDFGSLRNRTMGKLDWKGLGPGSVVELARAWG
ncbi:probable serine/threonine-protein kinase PBL19 [Phalaenopsis equestris]|uniref:probable serine/threonine-protein kinase PBL19 n=1 Tax=Phalaenopsis equestris TaxID=78828 RepID=UPI0009E1E53B|nr:probable serine/threonine-protein kinase PBL19 [Phalaenopsis equestris]